MSEIFPKGTKVRIGSEYTQSMETMGVVFEVQSRLEGDRIFGPKYRVTSPDGREWEFRASLLERVEETEGVFPKGTKVRIKPDIPQLESKRGKVFEVLSHGYEGHARGWMYLVRDPDGREGHMRDHLFERVGEPDLEEKVIEALKVGLGEDALVCTRDWSAWSYGTMSEDDFEQVADQNEWLHEIAKAILLVVKS